jgi:integrase
MIALRYKKLASGKYSIYLDCYNEVTQKRRYQFLKLHVLRDYSKVPKIAPADKEIMQLAAQLLHKAIQKQNINSGQIAEQKEAENIEAGTMLVSFIEKELLQKPHIQSKYLLKHLRIFLGSNEISIAKISLQWIMNFQTYLSSRLSENTNSSILLLLRTYFNRAINQGLLKNNPFEGYEIKKPNVEERPFLTSKEYKQLASTPTSFNPQIRDAFLFAYSSGLRCDDLKNLRQKQITAIEKQGKHLITIELKHLKSTRTYTVELSKEATGIIKRFISDKTELVFDKLPNKSYCNIKLRLWGAMAGLEKHVCFSIARNSYAINLLKSGHPLKETRKRMGLTNTHSARVYKTMMQKENRPL